MDLLPGRSRRDGVAARRAAFNKERLTGRILYLTQALTVRGGREAFAGRRLYDLLAEEADDAVVAHAVVPAGQEQGIALELLDKDVMTARSYLAYDSHVIYFEGGLFSGAGSWRVPRPLLEQSVRLGGVALIADAEFNELNQEREHYLAAWDFLRAKPNYGPNEGTPVYGVNRRTQERAFNCEPEQMVVSDWLRPVYDGVGRVRAVSPIDLAGWQEVLATGDRANTGTLADDVWIDEHAYCPFASVSQLGDGFVVFIAAAVSSDRVVEECPDNGIWIRNTIRFLRAESAKDAARYSGLRRLQRAFRDLNTTDDAVLEESVDEINRALDREAQATLRRKTANAARQQLLQIFGPRWDTLSNPAQRQLIQAEVYRRDAELLADTEEEFEFSAAVGAYSRAVEVELLHRLFEPFRERRDASELPGPDLKRGERESVDALRRFPRWQGSHQRADRLRPDERWLPPARRRAQCLHLIPTQAARESRPVLRSGALSAALADYTQKYRNRAMHAGSISQEDCKAARDYLFEEPVRLLLYLAEVLPA